MVMSQSVNVVDLSECTFKSIRLKNFEWEGFFTAKNSSKLVKK